MTKPEEIVKEGKTKMIVQSDKHPGLVIMRAKNDITKNDDERQTQTMSNKAAYATATTCAIFSLLKKAGIPVAFEEKISPTEFLAPKCKMIPLEVIIRRYAVGSYLKRFPNLQKGKDERPHRFHRLMFELFLKTTKGEILSYEELPMGNTPEDFLDPEEKPIDDPFISNPYGEKWELMHPKNPGWDPKSNLGIENPRRYFLPEGITVEMLEEITRKVFLVLEGFWMSIGHRLVDFKIEFGIDKNGNLLVADVIDNDSWRIRDSFWKEISKQLFRDGRDMKEIAEKYELVARLVNEFDVPQQAIVLWRGSDSDSFPDIPKIPGVNVVEITKSGHKSPRQALNALEDILTDYPAGGVILGFVGMSNGLVPTISARTSWPVIAIPVTVQDRPHDVWSNLEMPSQVPSATVLNPKNAVLAALNILGQKNPYAYMHRQYKIEQCDY